MALVIGELTGVISLDADGVPTALRRVEGAMRSSGQRLAGDADDAGQRAGQQLGGGLVRGADGQWRNLRGQLVDAVTAAALDAEAAARRGGQRAGQQLGDGLGDGATRAARRAGDDAGDALGDGLTRSGSAGADEAGETIGQRLTGRLKLAAAGAGVAAGAVLVAGFQEALDQSQITARLGAQLGTTPAVAQRYGKVAGALFKDAIVSDFQTGADTIRAIASEGLLPPGATNAQIKDISANAADLANAFDVDVAMAAQAAGIAVKTGLAKNSTEAFDLITQGMSGLGPAGEDLLETVNEYGVQFAKSGLSGRTAFGLMRQAIQAGWKDTDKVADAFKELELRVTGGGKAQVDALKSVGLNAKDMIADLSAGGARGEKAMAKIHDAILKLGPKSDVAKVAIQDLFGGPGEDLGAAFFKLNLREASKAMGGAEGAADKLGSGLRDNAGAKVKAFKNTMQQTFVEFLGTKVIPPLEKLFGFVKEHADVFVPAAAGVTALGAAFSLAAIGVWAMNSAMLANPMFWIIAGVVALIAGAVALIVLYWDDIVAATSAAWEWVVMKVRWAKAMVLAAIAYLGTLPGKVAGWWKGVKDKTVQIVTAWVAWVRGIPGRVWSAISGLAGRLRTASNNAWTSFRNAAAVKIVSFISWVRGIPGRVARAIGSVGNLLYSKGRNIVTGLWNGIVGMGGWLRSKIMGWARSVIPGPVAKALGISSPSKVMAKQVGRWIPRGIVAGIESTAGEVDRTMANLVRTPTPSASYAGAVGSAMSAGVSSGQRSTKTVQLTGGDDFGRYVIDKLRKQVAILGGDVQFVLGKG
ncbi:phage tail tape measure protein [Streptomyces sp. NBC_01017]|uniref:phage tail tape measure protein n=1 Tax=Streptomyces sp. NBC_01017 TaxID=2903721 RepID=UPI00386977A2|nr:phage tail tape measure protein [Streptomyces sp. NBC_01017]